MPTKPSALPARSRSQGRKNRTSRLMAISSAAIVTIYAAGFVRTEAAARQIEAPAAQGQAGLGAAPPAGTNATPTAPAAAGMGTDDAGTAGASDSPAAPAVITAPAPSVQPPADGAGNAPASTTTPIMPPAPQVPPAPAASASTAGVGSPAPASVSKPAAPAYKDGTYVAVGFGRHGPIEAAVVIQKGRIASANITRCGTRYPCSYVADLPGEVVARQSADVDYVSGATDSSMAYQNAVESALAQAR